MEGGANNDSLTGNGGNDTLFGDAGDDELMGEVGDDHLYAGSGHDTLLGSSGLDTLMGEDGNDTINGGADYDLMWGGNGNDTFVFSAGSGADVIYDFAAGGVDDRLDLSNSAFNFQNLQDVLNHTTNNAYGDCAIDLGGGDYVWLMDVLKTQLTASDFIF
jgi:serralysin